MLWTSIFVFAANIAAQQCVFGNSSTIVDFEVGKMGRQVDKPGSTFYLWAFLRRNFNISYLILLKYMEY